MHAHIPICTGTEKHMNIKFLSVYFIYKSFLLFLSWKQTPLTFFSSHSQLSIYQSNVSETNWWKLVIKVIFKPCCQTQWWVLYFISSTADAADLYSSSTLSLSVTFTLMVSILLLCWFQSFTSLFFLLTSK